MGREHEVPDLAKAAPATPGLWSAWNAGRTAATEGEFLDLGAEAEKEAEKAEQLRRDVESADLDKMS